MMWYSDVVRWESLEQREVDGREAVERGSLV